MIKRFVKFCININVVYEKTFVIYNYKLKIEFNKWPLKLYWTDEFGYDAFNSALNLISDDSMLKLHIYSLLHARLSAKPV